MSRYSETAHNRITKQFNSYQGENQKPIAKSSFQEQYAHYPRFITLPPLILIAYWYTKFASNRGYRGFISHVNIGMHEMGHLLFGLVGSDTIGILGGTVLQLFIPIAFFIIFYRQSSYYLAALSLGRLGSNFFYMARYAYDATRLELPLLSMGAPNSNYLTHDRNYLFDQRGVIQHTDQIAYGFATTGTLLMAACLLYAGRLIYRREIKNLPK